MSATSCAPWYYWKELVSELKAGTHAWQQTIWNIFYQFNQATTLFFWDILFQIFSKYWSDTLFKNQFIQVLCWGQWILQIKCILESPHSQDIYIISLNTFKYLIDWYQFYFWKIQRLSQWAKSPHTLVDQTTWSSSLFHSSFIIESH